MNDVSYDSLNEIFYEKATILVDALKARISLEKNIFTGEENATFIRGPYIIFSSSEFNIDNEFEKSVEFLSQVILTLERMGFDIKISCAYWKNMKDSCFNISGDKGFFCVKFEFKENENLTKRYEL